MCLLLRGTTLHRALHSAKKGLWTLWTTWGKVRNHQMEAAGTPSPLRLRGIALLQPHPSGVGPRGAVRVRGALLGPACIELRRHEEAELSERIGTAYKFLAYRLTLKVEKRGAFGPLRNLPIPIYNGFGSLFLCPTLRMAGMNKPRGSLPHNAACPSSAQAVQSKACTWPFVGSPGLPGRKRTLQRHHVLLLLPEREALTNQGRLCSSMGSMRPFCGCPPLERNSSATSC